jgi:putative ABC transport system permease protein
MEVGIRKTLGSQKTDIVRQFLIESGLISFISLVLALILALVALPFFNELAGKELQMPFENPLFWLVLLASTVLLALVSGSYPAFFMSRFGIVRVLKGTGDSGKGDGTVRNGLVVFQFAISIFLIIGTLVVFQQLKYIQNKDLGYSKEQVLVLNDLYMADEGIPSLKREIERLGQVNSVTVTGYLPTPSSRSDSSFYVEEKPNQEDAISLQHWVVDHDYAQTLGLQLIAGRDFDRERLTDSTAIVLNAKAAKVLGLTPQEVLGKRISSDMGSENPLFYTVIGVVEDFHFDSLKKDIEAWGMYLGNSRSRMAIKMETGNLAATINQIENLWHQLAPGAPFNYEFLDASFNDTYRAEQRLGRIFVIFTILSILIACLGLFGLAAFNADKRTKEIGVRKVMGASVGQITYRLTMDFLKLVGWAVLVALPIGWFAMDSWLKDFSYRINVSWWVLVLAAVLAAAIAIVTVGYQSIKAAVVNPVKSLRSE